MKDGLARTSTVIQDGTVAREEIAFASKLSGDQLQLTKQGLIFWSSLV